MSDTMHPGLRAGGVRFSVLGPLTAEYRGRRLSLGPLKQRLVLALLLCHPNTLVPVDLLVEAVWDDSPPRTARKNLQVYISALRKTLAEAGDEKADRLIHRPGGYVLRVAEPELDTLRFQALARAGRENAAEGAFETAVRLLGEARMLWAGPPLPELGCSAVLEAETSRLTNRYLAVCEDWAEAALEAGQARDVAEAVGELLEHYPLRERLRAAQMIALQRVGRRAEALAVYDDLRQSLSRELGLAPSPALDRLYCAVLSDDDGSGSAVEKSARRGGSVVLPPVLPDFTGRQEQIAELLRSVSGRGGVTVVVGPAGMGKTALAVHAAHSLAEEFPDGRICVRLRDKAGMRRSTAALTTELLRYAGLAQRIPGDPDQAAALWRAWLAENKTLLILDDAPDEAAIRPLLPGTGPSAAIVTARSRLVGLAPAHRIEVPPYSTPEALSLLARIIGDQRVHCDLPAAEQIVAAGGLVPLAVRIAGLKLAVLRHLPLAEYAARLADPRSVLDELAAGDIDLRSPVADEWLQLTQPQRSALLCLAMLPWCGAFTLEEAATALGCDRDRALRELELLIEAGAVVAPADEASAHTVLYALPHLTRLYALGQASFLPESPTAHGDALQNSP